MKHTYLLVVSGLLFAGLVKAADLSNVPQIHETAEQRDARMQWWRDAKLGMFLHWGPVSISGVEIGWGRKANRPWDINGIQTPRTEDPVYDNLYKQFNPVKFNGDEWVKIAQDAGMKYMVIICKHHDGFSMFDSKLTDYDIMATPYGRDIIKQFAAACHKAGMKLGLYYSTRDWYNPDYLVGDNAKYDKWYRSQIEELLSNYGKVDLVWFDHVGGRDWGKWKFDELFSMMYRLQSGLIVNDRSARFCGPGTPEDRGPATPEIRKMTEGDFMTPEQSIGRMELMRDWESCMTIGGGQWSCGKGDGTAKHPLDRYLGMLISCITGGGNLLLNSGPLPTGEIAPGEVAMLKQMGEWIKPNAEAIYGTRGGPYPNGWWGGSTHRGNTIYVFSRYWQSDKLRLQPLPWKVMAVKQLAGGKDVPFQQTGQGIDISLAADHRDPLFTVFALTVDQSVADGNPLQSGTPRSMFEDSVTYGSLISEKAKLSVSSTSAADHPANYPQLFAGERMDYVFHTANEKNPWIKIDLGDVKGVCGIRIENKTDDRRSEGLVLSVSEDGEKWTEVWKAELWDQFWEVPLTMLKSGAQVPGQRARYLKLELPTQREFLLRRVEIYGK